jgi:uncharacterized protein YkwD
MLGTEVTDMTRRTGILPLLGFVLSLLGLWGCGGDTLYDPEHVIPNRPPVASLAATPLEGIAPVQVSIQLNCSDPDGDPVEHLLDADGQPGYEIRQWTPISVPRPYQETTEVFGLCRDEQGAESSRVKQTIHVLNVAAQRATILSLTNAERQKVGAAALVMDQKLTEVAQAHARDMSERGYFSHTTPEGKTFGERLTEAGITERPAGENIAMNYSPEGAVSAWINSSGHFQNMTNKTFRRIGIGVYKKNIGGAGFTHYVQVFTS